MAIKTDKEKLTSAQQKQVEAAQAKWQAANKSGDKEGMEAAHREAEAVRNSAGYTSNADGTYKGAYSPSGGSSGGGSKGGNSQYTNTNKMYNPNTNYQALINDAVDRGDFRAAAIYEQLRNQKILGEGLDYETTNLYGSYLDGFNQQKNQQDAMDMFDQYVQEWEERNARPTEPERDPRIDAMLNQILNRDDFSYDATNDPLYQQYKQMYQREGDRAMRETLAEAASSAGGMNSYAITAAQQANNYYNSQMQDKIPELYQLAYDMYLRDKESQVQDLGLLQAMDDTQYNRYRNTMNDWYKDKDFAYGVYNDAVQQGNWQTNFDYGSTWDNINYNTYNYWKNKEWDASQEENAYNKNQYEQESAKEEVWKLISLGITPSAELIARAGMSQTDVNLAVAAVQAENAPKLKTSTSGSSKSGSKSRGRSSGWTGKNTGNTGNTNTHSDMSDYTLANAHGDDWVAVRNIGRLSYQELYNMVENGTVIEIVDNKNKKVSYRKA